MVLKLIKEICTERNRKIKKKFLDVIDYDMNMTGINEKDIRDQIKWMLRLRSQLQLEEKADMKN